MTQGDSCAPERISTVIYKRPLFPLKKEHNEIYITSATPLCVYYKRATQLLAWQLSQYFSLSTKKFMKENRVNQKTGRMANRSKVIPEHNAGVNAAVDGKALGCALSKRTVSCVDQKLNGVIIHGTGKCVNKALYLLHDVYDYVKDIYVKAQSRFNRSAVFQPCEKCANREGYKSGKRTNIATSEETCAGCIGSTNKYLEDIVKRILKVDISTGTVKCKDDVFQYTIEEGKSHFCETYSPLESYNTTLKMSQKDRMVSSIKIVIKVAMNP